MMRQRTADHVAVPQDRQGDEGKQWLDDKPGEREW